MPCFSNHAKVVILIETFVVYSHFSYLCRMILEIEDIGKSYSGREVLSGVNLSFDMGRVVGLLGPNGAGKSTLMKIVTGYVAADGGEVRIDGRRAGVDEVEVKRLVGYLPEHNPLYLDMYVKEYLEFTAAVYGIVGRERRSVVADVVERVGLTPECGKRIGALSKGYRQRVGIAAAIMHDPKVLILDEPTTGLDPNQLVDIRRLIHDLGRDRLVIFSTHIMQEVEQLCDEVVMLRGGRIVLRIDKTEAMERYGTMESMFRSLSGADAEAVVENKPF